MTGRTLFLNLNYILFIADDNLEINVYEEGKQVLWEVCGDEHRTKSDATLLVNIRDVYLW
jgi:hypothetical protein